MHRREVRDEDLAVDVVPQRRAPVARRGGSCRPLRARSRVSEPVARTAGPDEPAPPRPARSAPSCRPGVAGPSGDAARAVASKRRVVGEHLGLQFTDAPATVRARARSRNSVRRADAWRNASADRSAPVQREDQQVPELLAQRAARATSASRSPTTSACSPSASRASSEILLGAAPAVPSRRTASRRAQSNSANSSRASPRQHARPSRSCVDRDVRVARGLRPRHTPARTGRRRPPRRPPRAGSRAAGRRCRHRAAAAGAAATGGSAARPPGSWAARRASRPRPAGRPTRSNPGSRGGVRAAGAASARRSRGAGRRAGPRSGRAGAGRVPGPPPAQSSLHSLPTPCRTLQRLPAGPPRPCGEAASRVAQGALDPNERREEMPCRS